MEKQKYNEARAQRLAPWLDALAYGLVSLAAGSCSIYLFALMGFTQ